MQRRPTVKHGLVRIFALHQEASDGVWTPRLPPPATIPPNNTSATRTALSNSITADVRPFRAQNNRLLTFVGLTTHGFGSTTGCMSRRPYAARLEARGSRRPPPAPGSARSAAATAARPTGRCAAPSPGAASLDGSDACRIRGLCSAVLADVMAMARDPPRGRLESLPIRSIDAWTCGWIRCGAVWTRRWEAQGIGGVKQAHRGHSENR